MPKRTVAKKNTVRKPKGGDIWGGFKEFGRGFLKFFEIIFKFVLNFLKLLPEFIRAIALIILAVGFISFLFTVIMIYFLSVLGINESEEWQLYREKLLDHVFEEMAEDMVE